MSEILEDSGKRVSGGHTVLICKCHKCGDTFEIQRRRFLASKPCLLCVRKNQNAWKPIYDKISALEAQNLELTERLERSIDCSNEASKVHRKVLKDKVLLVEALDKIVNENKIREVMVTIASEALAKVKVEL